MGDGKLKRKLLILVFTTCLVVAGSVAMVFYALAAAQITLKSTIAVDYDATPNVVCSVNATYQKEKDAAATTFVSGDQTFAYVDSSKTKTLTASNASLVLDDMTSKYVVFTFTFTNQNLMAKFDIDIKLTDNSVTTNMSKKYYFGSLASANLDNLASRIREKGVDASALSSQGLTLGYQQTGKIYLLVEIISGLPGSYTANTTNGFKFALSASQGDGVAWLSSTWKTRLSLTSSSVTSVVFTKDSSKISGLANSASVGTNSATSTTAYVDDGNFSDVTAYWGSDKTSIVIYSPATIYAPANCNSMFSGCYALTTLDVSNFNTSSVTNMGTMFNNCNKLTTLDVSNFDTSKVTAMNSMFFGCSGLTTLDVSNFDTGKVTVMYQMFCTCYKLTALNLSNFDTSQVQNMFGMFTSCSGLTNLNVSNFNTSKVTNMSQMFYFCSGLTSLDVSNFVTSMLASMEEMFFYCSKLTSLDVSGFDTSKVWNMQGMFRNCSSLTSLDVTHFNTSSVTNMGYMFYNCSGLTSLNLGSFNLSVCTNFTDMLSSCSALTSITLPYNLGSSYTITLPASTYYNGSAGPYSTVGTATSGTTVACSTESSKVTLTKK